MADDFETPRRQFDSTSSVLGEAVEDLMDSVFNSVDVPMYDNYVGYKDDEPSVDPKFCPRAVNLERNPRIEVNDTNSELKLVRHSLGDTHIDEVLNEDGDFCNVSMGDYLEDESCPQQFQVDDVVGKISEENFDVTDETLRTVTKSSSYMDDYVDEAILRLKREMLTDDSEDEELDESANLDYHVLSSTALNQLKSPRLVPDQARQNILATLVHGVERKLQLQRRRDEDAKKATDRQSPCGKDDVGEKDKCNCKRGPVSENRTHEFNLNILDLSDTYRQMDEKAESIIDDGSTHLRESLLGVLEALKYVFQTSSEDDPDDTESTPTDTRLLNVDGQSVDTDGQSENTCDAQAQLERSTQTGTHKGTVGREAVDIDLLIAGLHEEFQRCLWVHQKITEDAYQLGFDRGLQNALFLQDLTEQSVQMIWCLREERRQLEKYVKDKERDWKTMSRAFTQEILDLRRENYQLISADNIKDGNGGRRIKQTHLKTLLKAKHDLERAFGLNVEKQDKINELKMLVLKQQKCIRSLQERLIEDQAAAMLLQYEKDHPQNTEDRPDDAPPEPTEEETNATANNENNVQTEDTTRNQTGPSDTGASASSDPFRAEDVAKLQDVLYCDHGNFAPHHSTDPEIAAIQVYGIGGEEVLGATDNSTPGFNVLDLNYTQTVKNKTDLDDSLGFETSEIVKPEVRKLASGDSCDPSPS